MSNTKRTRQRQPVNPPNPALSAILVWPFDEAPLAYQELSTHGGDEDWAAWVPQYLANQYIGWLDGGTPFGCCSVSTHELPNGSLVKIGAHA